MVGNLTALAETVISQCEMGVYEPHEGKAPIDLLARGMIENATGSSERAKDLLSEAYRLLDGDYQTKAGVQLSIAYWRGGEDSEALALLDTLPQCFESLLTRAIILTDSDPDRALGLLTEAQQYDVSPYMWGRLHNQRGMCLRLLGEDDRAVLEYEAALYFLRDTPLASFVKNNQGRVLKSHEQMDKAIENLSGAHLAKAYDQKAVAFLQEKQFEKADEYSRWAVGLLDRTDRLAWLAECLITRSRALRELERFMESLQCLSRVSELGEYLGVQHIQFSAANEIYETARRMSKCNHVKAASLALQISDGRLRKAAGMMGVSHQSLKEFANTNKLKFRPHVSVIKKPQY